MPKKKKGKATSTGKVFRITVLGRAESGKTALCMRYITNTALKMYEHTISAQLYHREVDIRNLQPKMTGSLNDGGGGASHGKSKKKKKKPAKKKKGGQQLTMYGIQIEDVPGEITGTIEDRTAEKNAISRSSETNDGYKQLYHDTSGWLGVPDESTSLIPKSRSRGVANEVEKNVNLLYIPMMTDGYIVVFDIQSTDSLSKARALIKAIHQSPNKDAPILLLGNKTDVARGSADMIRKAGDVARASKSHAIFFAHGSTHINQFEFEDQGMDCYNLMNEFVQKLHGKKRGVNSMQYESKFQQRGKKFKRGRGGGGIDDNDEDQESGVCSCLCRIFMCQCCSCWTTGEDGDEDLAEMTNV